MEKRWSELMMVGKVIAVGVLETQRVDKNGIT